MESLSYDCPLKPFVTISFCCPCLQYIVIWVIVVYTEIRNQWENFNKVFLSTILQALSPLKEFFLHLQQHHWALINLYDWFREHFVNIIFNKSGDMEKYLWSSTMNTAAVAIYRCYYMCLHEIKFIHPLSWAKITSNKSQFLAI